MTLLIIGCTKEKNPDPLPPGISAQFVANWKVHESVTTTGGTFQATDDFNAYSIKVTDSTFGVVQINRSPRPAWLGVPGGSSFYQYALDTIKLKPIVVTRTLFWNIQGPIGSYTVNKDTLQFTYQYNTSIRLDALYLVSQTWVKL